MQIILDLNFVWNEPNQKWLIVFSEDYPIKEYRGKFLYDVWDCVMVNELLGLDKTKGNEFKVTFEKKDERIPG